jgi:hypothetical protein
MGCGCSAKKVNKEKELSDYVFHDSSSFSKDNNLKESIFSKIMFQTLKIIAFLFMLLFIPIIMVAVVWFIFNIVVLNKDVNIKRIVTVLASKLKRFNEDEFDTYDEDDYDEDDYDEENYELIDVEEIK